jgi:hypothetical protein
MILKANRILRVTLFLGVFFVVYNTGYYLGAINQQGFDATPRAYMAVNAIEFIDKGQTAEAKKLLKLWLKTDLSSFEKVTDFKSKNTAYLAPLHLFLKVDSVEYAKKVNEKLLSNSELYDGAFIEERYIQ